MFFFFLYLRKSFRTSNTFAGRVDPIGVAGPTGQ